MAGIRLYRALLAELRSRRARIIVGATAVAAARDGGRVTALEVKVSGRNRTFPAEAVVLATGGESLPKTGSDGAGFQFAQRFGHTIVPTTPALVPLVLDEAAGASIHRELSGVSHPVALHLWIDGRIAERQEGSLLWTHFGISGPVALNMSRHWLRAR